MDSGPKSRRESVLCLGAVVLAALLGLALMAHEAVISSATYDEPLYLQVAARWWRTGDQEEITRMGSPLTFWKLQQAPVLAALDLVGRRELVDDPKSRVAAALPIARIGSLWVWLVALGLTAFWANRLDGPRAMAFAAWLFTLSPNLLAHGALVTMEMPLVAASAGVFLAFWLYLKGGRTYDLVIAAALCGVAFSCKFTAVMFPPILAVCWWVDRVGIADTTHGWLGRGHRRPGLQALGAPGHSAPATPTPDAVSGIRPRDEGWARAGLGVAAGMTGFVILMLAVDWAVTGFVTLPMSPTKGPHPSLDGRFGATLGRLVTRAVETPVPQDWVGFASQMARQRSGGPSYLLGERRTHGWWYYYLIALAVKAPLSLGLLVALRVGIWRNGPDAASRKAWFPPLVIALFLAVTAAGSSRNYGVRYLLPVSPVAVVWLSGLAGRKGVVRVLAWSLLAAQGMAVASIHPHELSFFNTIAGGPVGGRRVLADSNLDWGQGLLALGRLQEARPEFRDIAIYQFGELTAGTARNNYRIDGTLIMVDAGDRHPDLRETFRVVKRPYVAVSASLQWGPWGPPGYFRRLDGVKPVAMTDDFTIAVYRTADLRP